MHPTEQTAAHDADQVRLWAARFALLGCPSRLALLRAIDRTGPVSVSELAAASAMTPTAVSHSLRLLKAHGMIHGQRIGQQVRYRVTQHSALTLVRSIDEATPVQEPVTAPQHRREQPP